MANGMSFANFGQGNTFMAQIISEVMARDNGKAGRRRILGSSG